MEPDHREARQKAKRPQVSQSYRRTLLPPDPLHHPELRLALAVLALHGCLDAVEDKFQERGAVEGFITVGAGKTSGATTPSYQGECKTDLLPMGPAGKLFPNFCNPFQPYRITHRRWDEKVAGCSGAAPLEPITNSQRPGGTREIHVRAQSRPLAPSPAPAGAERRGA